MPEMAVECRQTLHNPPAGGHTLPGPVRTGICCPETKRRASFPLPASGACAPHRAHSSGSAFPWRCNPQIPLNRLKTSSFCRPGHTHPSGNPPVSSDRAHWHRGSGSASCHWQNRNRSAEHGLPHHQKWKRRRAFRSPPSQLLYQFSESVLFPKESDL